MREDRASGELTAARQAVRTAAEALESRRRELEEFSRTKDERRDRIYATIMGRPVSREQIDLAQEGVARIDEEGALRADNVLRAQSELKTREAEAETAREAFIAASKNRMKIDEHRAVWVAEEAREQENRAEGELEDFTGRKQDLDS
jgi:hypothetical protein